MHWLQFEVDLLIGWGSGVFMRCNIPIVMYVMMLRLITTSFYKFMVSVASKINEVSGSSQSLNASH